MVQEFIIVQDSREKKKFWNEDKQHVTKALKTGDYSILNLEEEVSIERKEVSDIFSTLSSGHKRFKKELERARKLKFFAVVIEGSYRAVRDKDFEGSFHSKMRGYIINKIIFTLVVKYGVHIFFASDRSEAKSITRELLNAYWRNRKPTL